jgi:hypothetical protein
LIVPYARCGPKAGKKAFFLEKKNHKTSALQEFTADTRGTPKSQSFCFFFQIKVLPCFARATPGAAGTAHPALSSL